MYFNQSIYIATYLYMVYLDSMQVVCESNSRCTWKWQLCKLSDTFWSHNWASVKMKLEAVIECIWRYTIRPWWHEVSDALQTCDQGGMEIYKKAIIVRSRRPQSSGFGGTLGECEEASLEMHWEAIIIWNWGPELRELRNTECRLWSSVIGHVWGGGHWTAHQVLTLYSSGS